MKTIEVKTLRKELKKIGWNIKVQTFSHGQMASIFNIENKHQTIDGIFSTETYKTSNVKMASDLIKSYKDLDLVDKYGNHIGGFKCLNY